MCSQRAAFAVFWRRLTRRLTGLTLTVVKRDDPQFAGCRDGHLLWTCVECQILAMDVVAAVFARGFDADGVFAGLHELAFVVLAVPLQGVGAGRPRCRGYRA